MCEYFSKTENQFSQIMKQPANEAFENNMHHRETKKTFSKAYLSNQEYSAQETVYHILPEFSGK